jgi:prepilin-type N-terminal cleavage/methylation domain-containing protein
MELLKTRKTRGDEGFSLVETMVALALLAIGLLSLAGVFTMSLARMTGASWDILAKEKASEAIENILAARDSGRLSWAQINNVGNGGVFVAGEQALIAPGNDRLIGTGDDNAADPETVRRPGPNGIIDGGGDDEVVTLGNFTRQIVISSVPPGDTLRQIRVIIRYTSAGLKRQIEMSSYVSSFTG